MTSAASNYVKEFHEAFGVPVHTEPGIREHRAALRHALILEEFEEFDEALTNNDIVEVADALADLIYVIYGTAHEFGIPLDEILAEVHASNMSKLGEDGKPIHREDGKVLKGPGFFRPNIAKFL
jgi:predicted HAD superfamily Cof-like phosphohydrolase